MKKAGETGSTAEREQFKDQWKSLTAKILESKERNWRDLCSQIDRDPWGLPYRIVMKMLSRRRPIPGLEIPGRLDSIIGTLFPRRAINPRALLAMEEDELEMSTFSAKVSSKLLAQRKGTRIRRDPK